MTAPRELDLVLYGATGFTGRLAARYLADRAPAALRWAVAGRDRGKLEALQGQLTGCAAPPAAVVVAEAGDPASIEALARGARVVASTAGPFARYSDPVVAACAVAGTHYADITGETPWVRRLIDRDHERAVASGARLVPCCGFDSVPSDLGALLLVERVRQLWGQPTRRVTAAFSLGGGGLNGGTAASALAMAEAGEAAALDDPLLLVPPGGRGAVRARPPRRRSSWEPDLGTWLAPFVMAPVNTQVVLRSAALWAGRGAPYGPSFAYDEGLASRGRLRAGAATAGLALGERVLRSALGRAALRRLAPAPGEGPSEAAMRRGWFRCRLLAEAEDGRRAVGELSFAGDAGNRATVLMLSEAALALALEGERLPPGGGVLTPASALGGVLLERLRAAGVQATAGPAGGRG